MRSVKINYPVTMDIHSGMRLNTRGVQAVVFDSFTEFAAQVGEPPAPGQGDKLAWQTFASMSTRVAKVWFTHARANKTLFGGNHRVIETIGNYRIFGLTNPMAWDDTTKLLLGGWPQGEQAMREGIGALRLPEAADLRRKARWSDQGEEVCLSRYMAGSSTAWRTMTRRTIKAPPRVRIVVDINYWCSACGYKIHDQQPTSPSEMLWRGAAACMLTEVLSKAGWQVELVAGEVGVPEDTKGKHSSNAFAYLVRVKGFGQPLNLAAAAGMTGHAAAARQGGNLCLSKYCEDSTGAWVDSGLRLAHLPETLYTQLGFPSVTNTLYVPSDTLSQRKAQRWAKEALETLQARVL